MKRVLDNATRCAPALAVLLLACSSSDKPGVTLPAPTAGMPSIVGATGTAGAAQGTGRAGTTGAAGSPINNSSGVAGTRGAAGMMAGTPAAISSTAGAAGMTLATAGTAGSATAGVGATAGAGAAGGGSATTSARPLSSTLKLATMKENKAVAPFFNIWRPADLTKVEGKLPIFVWNNGACSRNDAVFKPLFDAWSSGGYFVLSLTSGQGGRI